MTAFIIIFYNNPDFLLKQYDHLKRFCTEPYELLVIDNSSDLDAAESMKYHADRLGLRYLKTNATSNNGSDSHAFSLSLAYFRFKRKFDIITLLDHDCIPIKPFSPRNILGDKLIAGLPQERNGITYYWPGCTMFYTKVEMDFSLAANLDTGGNTYKAIEAVGIENCIFFDEQYSQNPGFTIPPYNFYALLHNGTWMHFINGSNWAKSDENTERLNSLFNVLSGYLNPSP